MLFGFGWNGKLVNESHRFEKDLYYIQIFFNMGIETDKKPIKTII